MRKIKIILGCLLGILVPNLVFASSSSTDYFPLVLIAFSVVIFSASIGSSFANKIGQPPVLGELLIGLLISNIFYFLGYDVSQLIFNLDLINNYLVTNNSSIFTNDLLKIVESNRLWLPVLSTLFVFSSFGALFLLFAIGLETPPSQFLKVGISASIVAVIGVIVPCVLGFVFCKVVLSDSSFYQNIFIAATLCATSVGITARVFKDLKITNLKESKIILGAAVVDDILGLVILAICIGLFQTGKIDYYQIFILLLQISILFLLIFIYGQKIFLKILKYSKKFFGDHFVTLLPLVILLILSFIAIKLGLAGIIGAFLAGLTLSSEEIIKELDLKSFFEPLEKIFSPIFFILMGLQVNLSLLLDIKVVLISIGLIIIAIISKLVSGIFLPKGTNKFLVGMGMVPRGEVGLIFAGIGKSIGAISSTMFSSIVIMVLITTFIVPFIIKKIVSK